MDKIVIRGGAALRGTVALSGSKNATLPIMMAAVLTDEPVLIHNVPRLRDVSTAIGLLAGLGVEARWTGDHDLELCAARISSHEAPYELVKTMRASFVVLGPLLARAGRARVSTPGGCAIGARPVNLHIVGIRALGARIQMRNGYVEAHAPRLTGARIWLDMPSVGATENIMVAAAITGGDLFIREAPTAHLEAVIAKLVETGAQVAPGEGGLRVSRSAPMRPVELRTLPYPGFPTDLQAQMMALLTQASGTSVISETIFENRFMHALELLRMGADIVMKGATAVIRGPAHLSGARVMATDLRASMSLILAGLSAENTTEVSRVYHLDRGYEALDQKLKSLGAQIERVSE